MSRCLSFKWLLYFDTHTHTGQQWVMKINEKMLFCLVVWACTLEFARPCALLSTCHVVCTFWSAACIHVMSCAVWHAACVFHWLCAFMLSGILWTRGLKVFSLAACSCPVLHMCLCFCLVWAHGFCLSFLCAMCCHDNCLDPTHLVTWLLVNLPHLSSLITLLICSLYNLLVFAVLCQFIIDVTLVVSCPALPCPALPCPALPCPALPCLFYPTV